MTQLRKDKQRYRQRLRTIAQNHADEGAVITDLGPAQQVCVALSCFVFVFVFVCFVVVAYCSPISHYCIFSCFFIMVYCTTGTSPSVAALRRGAYGPADHSSG
jgi:hypothetical protein